MSVGEYKPWHIFLGALAQLQIISVMLNLIPIPPLDGFGVIAPYMDEETRSKVTTPPLPLFALIVMFLVLSNVPQVREGMFRVKTRILEMLGFRLLGDRHDPPDASTSRSQGETTESRDCQKKTAGTRWCQPRAMGFRPGFRSEWVGMRGQSLGWPSHTKL
jgi:hypothetical protein